MAKEIERKFLVTSSSYRELAVEATDIVQGYISRTIDSTVRIRIYGNKAFITVKSRNRGSERDEWEYEIPIGDAREMLCKCAQGNVIEKRRYIVPCQQLRWEIDEFFGRHAGLVIAEIELPESDTQFARPPFIGKEVTGDPKYYNSNL